jgi:hypothetical protein
MPITNLINPTTTAVKYPISTTKNDNTGIDWYIAYTITYILYPKLKLKFKSKFCKEGTSMSFLDFNRPPTKKIIIKVSESKRKVFTSVDLNGLAKYNQITKTTCVLANTRM